MRKKLQALRDFMKCVIRIHHLPENLAFEEASVIIAGGVCPRCGEVKWGKPVGDVMDLNGHQIKGVNGYTILPTGYAFLCSLNTMEAIYEHDPVRWQKILNDIPPMEKPSAL